LLLFEGHRAVDRCETKQANEARSNWGEREAKEHGTKPAERGEEEGSGRRERRKEARETSHTHTPLDEPLLLLLRRTEPSAMASFAR